LLETNATLRHIKGYVKNAIAATPDRLTDALNDWLHVQQPKNLTEKKELADFVNWLSRSYDSALVVDGEPCYLAAVGGYGVPTGRFLITRVGANKPSITRVEAADLPRFKLVSNELLGASSEPRRLPLGQGAKARVAAQNPLLNVIDSSSFSLTHWLFPRPMRLPATAARFSVVPMAFRSNAAGRQGINIRSAARAAARDAESAFGALSRITRSAICARRLR
jgi:hypothetical protein